MVVGLDTFASRSAGRPTLTEDDEQAFDDAGLKLCGGICSGSESSFRGKVYAELIAGVTGVSLYEQWIGPEVVRDMADALETCDPVQVAEPGTPPSALRDLGRFFRICADRDLGLVGWW
jgi:hypothetical protein